MLTIDAQGIRDFQICPLLYHLRHEQKTCETISSAEIMAQRYDNTLRKVVFFFLFKWQGELAPGLNTVLNRWEKLWFPKGMDAYDVAVMQTSQYQNNLLTYSNAAVNSLKGFYEDFTGQYAELGHPISLNDSYIVPISKNTKLTGSIDLVLQNKNTYNVIKFNTSPKRAAIIPNEAMELAAMRYAYSYKNSSDDKQNIEYKLYDVATDEPGFSTLTPSLDDVRALLYWAEEAADAVTFSSKRGLTTYCAKCPYYGRECKQHIVTTAMLKEQLAHHGQRL